MTDQTISHYKVRGELGRGGMGVVYKADDTKLNRTVALKVLPPHALSSQDDRARFYREARAAAALHHPHIATVFEIDEHEGQPFIAMEYIDGQCLDDRIAEGLMPLKEVVSIATQVADALKAAHDKDIVHRDIKSGNVMLTSSGVAKVLDFGLAKTAASTKLTQMGSTLGTVAYMSPEQARGEDVDRRADLWSLGAVMYEMISGKLPFPGDFEQAVIYSILNEEPKPLTSIRTGVPMGLEWIVTKLLAKKPDERYQNAGDLLVDLRTVDLDTVGMSRVSAQSRIAAPAPAIDPPKPGGKGGSGVLRLALAFAAGLILMTGIWYLMPASEDAFVETSVKRFEITLPTTGSLGGLDISPDGSKIVYTDVDNTVDNVYILDLTTGKTRKIEGSAGTVLVSVSPDGEWILLTKGLSVDRVPISGGNPLEVTVSQEGTPRAGWGHGDWVVFENQQAIWKVSTSTREAVPLSIKDTLAGEVDHDWPQLLPDGRTIVATIEFQNRPSAIGFWDLETGERKGQISLPGYRVQYISTGHLLFVLSSTVGNLVALPFDLSTLTATGSPVPVKTNVSTLIAAVSDGGTLVTGGLQGNESAIVLASRLAITTFPGIVSPLGFEPLIYRNFELSPDGKKLVAEINGIQVNSRGVTSGPGEDVWVLDLERQTKLQLTFGGTGRSPTWTAGGDSVVYIEVRPQGTSVVVRSADGSGEVRKLFEPFAGLVDVDISPAGTHAAYILGETDTGVTRLIVRDLRTGETVDISGEGDANIRRPRFSPDSRYVAYERGSRIWVRAIDGNGVPIFVGQASHARWARDGAKIFDAARDIVFAKDISLAPKFSVTSGIQPTAYGIGPIDLYDVFEDGRAGIFNLSGLDGASTDAATSVGVDSTVTVQVTVNWFETLK